MKIVNATKNSILAEAATVALSIGARTRGLLGKRELRPGQALVIKPCNSIHTFFMRFPIDAVFVDPGNKVVKTISAMRPFRLSGIYVKASFTIELPAGAIAKSSTQIGDTLAFQ